jgi:DNA-binding LytR/AlgR family response regulator
MINCYVIDDEEHAVEILSDLIRKTPGLELLGSSTDPLVGLEVVTSGVPPDLLFVDINMPGINGIEFAGLTNSYSTIIFTTAYHQFAVEAFEKEAFDYLPKPITQERFLKSIVRYKRQCNKSFSVPTEEYFYVKGDVKGKMMRVNVQDITYIEGALNYIIIHTNDEKNMITYLTMGEIMNSLPENRFSRIHKSFIINNDKIKLISGNDITLNDKTILNLGAAYKDIFYNKLQQKVVKTKRVQ